MRFRGRLLRHLYRFCISALPLCGRLLLLIPTAIGPAIVCLGVLCITLALLWLVPVGVVVIPLTAVLAEGRPLVVCPRVGCHVQLTVGGVLVLRIGMTIGAVTNLLPGGSVGVLSPMCRGPTILVPIIGVSVLALGWLCARFRG